MNQAAIEQAAAPLVEGVEKVTGAIFLGNTAQQWIWAAGAAAATLVVLYLAKTILIHRFRVLAKKTDNLLDDVVLDVLSHHTHSWFLLSIALWVGHYFLTLSPKLSVGLRSAFLILLGVQALFWASSAVDYHFGARARREGKGSAASSTYGIITFLSKLGLGALVVLLTLHNLGVNITALVAGLGIGGVAVALALQNILSDLFASMSIVLDKPFEIGDFIVVGELMGTVEAVGLKTTRVRSLSGEQLIFANADLLQSRVRNMQRMVERRMVFRVGVIYETPREKLALIPRLLREAVLSQSRVRFDRANLATLGDFAIVYEVAYFILDPDYNLSMDIQQAIWLEVIASFDREGISFAYPTSLVYLGGGKQPAGEV